MTEPKLKACPYCGNTSFRMNDDKYIYWLYICNSCEAATPAARNKEEVVRLANTRPIETQLYEACKAAVHAMSYDAAQSTSEYMDALDTLQAAIAAAEGAP